MVLWLEQCVFIVKWYHETHSLKLVHHDFIQEFPNSVSLSNHAKLNLIKFENEYTLDDLPFSLSDLLCSGWPSVVISEKRKAITKNVTEHPTASSRWLAQQVGLLHMLTYHALRSLGFVHTCRQKPQLSIDKSPILSVDCCRTNLTWFRNFCPTSQPATCLRTIAELCPKTQVRNFAYKCVLNLRADLVKIAEFCQRIHYHIREVLVFDTFFFRDEAWFHLNSYTNSQNNLVWSSKNPQILRQCCCICNKLVFDVPWVAKV